MLSHAILHEYKSNELEIARNQMQDYKTRISKIYLKLKEALDYKCEYKWYHTYKHKELMDAQMRDRQIYINYCVKKLLIYMAKTREIEDLINLHQLYVHYLLSWSWKRWHKSLWLLIIICCR
eukprot:NODE_880_length_3342_cov_0.600987.p3 type:complete len:122 gc:universal NODE_880_length_3342_cov_0.600987:2100-2465(+)